MKLVTATASRVSLCLIFFHINYPQANQFYDASDDWNKKQAVIESIAYIYEGLDLPETVINLDETTYKSLYIPYDRFQGTKKSFDVDLQENRDSLIANVGAGGAFAHIKNSTYVAYGGWSSSRLKGGNAFVLRYENDIPIQLFYKAVAGVSSPYLIQHQDDSGALQPNGIFFPGHDEAEAFVEGAESDGVLAGESYYFDLSDLDFKKASEELYEGHHNNVFDWNNDGKDDILRAGWESGLGLWLNNGNSFSHVPLGVGGSVIAAKHDESGSISVFIGDAVGDPIYPKPYNVIRTYDPSIQPGVQANILSRQRFLEPIFEGENYKNAESFYSDFQSHEVSGQFFDIDHDGDKDLVVGSMIWGDEHLDLLMIYIYENGNWTDETHKRLHNYHMIGSGNHMIYFHDVNHDGFIDILTSDHGHPFGKKLPNSEDFENAYWKGQRVLINDGTGHFSVVAREQVSVPELWKTYTTSSLPWLSKNGILRWTLFRIEGDTGNTVDIHTQALKHRLSTGPNGIDPAEFNEPDFNEFYYLLHNSAVREEIHLGNYVNGLDHYLKKGKAQGLTTHRNHPDLAMEYIFDGTTCKSSDPSNGTELQSRESGLTNSSFTKSIEVTCPVWSLAQKGEVTRATRSDYFLAIKNLSESASEFSCSLREMIQEEVYLELSSSRNLKNNETGVNAWRNITTSNKSSSLHINCSLPPSGVITELKVRTYNS